MKSIHHFAWERPVEEVHATLAANGWQWQGVWQAGLQQRILRAWPLVWMVQVQAEPATHPHTDTASQRGPAGGPGRLRRHPKPHMGPASAAGCGATFEGRAVAVAWVCRPRGGAARYTFHGFGDDGLPIAAKGADVTKSGLSSVAYAGKNLASCTGTRPALPTCACLSVSVCVCSLVLAAMFLFLLVL